MMLSARILTAANARLACVRFWPLVETNQQQAIRFFSTTLPNCRSQFSKGQVMKRNFQTSTSKPNANEVPPPPSNGAKPTLGERFKAAYRQYGKVLIGVHLVLSCGWFGSFYLVASSGVDVAGILEKYGINNERISAALRSSAGNAAIAYLLYKIASPVRYAMTLGGTHIAVRALRRFGYLRTPVYSKQIKK